MMQVFLSTIITSDQNCNIFQIASIEMRILFFFPNRVCLFVRKFNVMIKYDTYIILGTVCMYINNFKNCIMIYIEQVNNLSYSS